MVKRSPRVGAGIVYPETHHTPRGGYLADFIRLHCRTSVQITPFILGPPVISTIGDTGGCIGRSRKDEASRLSGRMMKRPNKVSIVVQLSSSCETLPSVTHSAPVAAVVAVTESCLCQVWQTSALTTWLFLVSCLYIYEFKVKLTLTEGASLMAPPSYNPTIEELINQLHLNNSWAARQQLQRAQYLSLVAYALSIVEKTQELQDRMNQKLGTLMRMQDHLSKDLVALTRYCARPWTMTETQMKLITKIVKHILVQPVLGYGQLTVDCIFNFVNAHAQQLKLDGLITEPVIRQLIHDFVERTELSERLRLKEAISDSLQGRVSLDVFLSRLLDDFWGAVQKPSPARKRSIMAHFADARSCMRASRWTAIEFWPCFNTHLNGLAVQYGTVPGRNSEIWRDWENKVIAEDVKEYGTGKQGARNSDPASSIALAVKMEALIDIRDDEIM
ncbi:hypothetical protein NM688_g5172 [Phlebia brevispora]|uniref:Uncharacterized protein n=1 Tax=Phlebia brevispora TaxID=194682 RepID=A0ACC1SZM4_9APHY|nr:hypothetical protein NM688_g5172 [Phlebia brevispora]